MSILLQATQPAGDAGITWDKITGFVLALTGLVAAIAALLKTGTVQGAVKALADSVDRQSQTSRQMRSDLTQVALRTPTGTGDGGNPPEAEPFSNVPRVPPMPTLGGSAGPTYTQTPQGTAVTWSHSPDQPKP